MVFAKNMTNQYYGYIRVSTAKQGEHGVSLQEQREAIERYAVRFGLQIVSWFEERETAAKRGRPVFNQMLGRLRQGRALGVIIHKIDRSARNLKDWADLGVLIDQGIEVHFANESLDLHSRGGRLSADIQAVVAADFIRNLREETRKGLYGRLKQGFYPLRAPIGYLDQGKAKAKIPDPIHAPLVREAFRLYASGTRSLDSLVEELYQRGLRNKRGGKVSRNGLVTFLTNPFYIGLMHIKKTNQTFEGNHEPLVSKALFERVRDVMSGKATAKARRHDYLFRRLLFCRACGYALIGERQKGHVYYRCHNRECGASLREEAVERAMLEAFTPLRLSSEERRYLERHLSKFQNNWLTERESRIKGLTLELEQLSTRLDRLTDAYLDRAIEREIYEARKTALLLERRGLTEQLNQEKGGNGPSLPERLKEFLELASSAYLGYLSGLPEAKRELVNSVTSNRWVERKNVVVELRQPFRVLAERHKTGCCDPYRAMSRTLKETAKQITKWLQIPGTVSGDIHAYPNQR